MSKKIELNTIPELVEDIREGRMVILMDDEERENEGDLVMAASKVRPEDINFMARFGRGLICLPLTRERCRQLSLPLMVNRNQGSGTRILIDRLLAGARPNGYGIQARNHNAVAAAVTTLFVATSLALNEGRLVPPLDDAYIHFQYAARLAAGAPGLDEVVGRPYDRRLEITLGSEEPGWHALLGEVGVLDQLHRVVAQRQGANACCCQIHRRRGTQPPQADH